jgi:hypothetical protein
MKSPKEMLTDATQKAVDLAARVLGPKDSVGDWHARDAALRQEHEAAETELRWLLSVGPPISELLEALDADLAKIGAKRAELGAAVVAALTPAIDTTPAGEFVGLTRYTTLLDVLRQPWGEVVAPLVLAQLRAACVELITASGYQGGPAMAARPARVAAAKERIARAEAAHEEHVTAAEKQRIGLQHLPAVTFRRGREAAARAAWARDQLANSAYYAQHPNERPPEPASSETAR